MDKKFNLLNEIAQGYVYSLIRDCSLEDLVRKMRITSPEYATYLIDTDYQRLPTCTEEKEHDLKMDAGILLGITLSTTLNKMPYWLLKIISPMFVPRYDQGFYEWLNCEYQEYTDR